MFIADDQWATREGLRLLLDKLGVDSRVHAAIYAYRHGLVTWGDSK